jgi:hypothetical protein
MRASETSRGLRQRRRPHPAARRVASVLALAMLAAGCGGSSGQAPPVNTDSTPTNRSSNPQPTADSAPQGGAGGPSVGDPIGAGSGISGSGGAAY